jgi:aspartate aminotransferase-like enzyme
MEGAVANLLNPGDRAICVVGGKFGERWSQIVSRFGGIPVDIEVPWGKAVEPEAVAKELADDPSIKAVFLQASETSTGVAHPVREVAGIVAGLENTVIVVDAISAVGVMNLPVDEWGLDVVVGGSQKAWGLPPGLAFASVSTKAWNLVERCESPRFYFDWEKERNSLGKDTTAYTPAVSLIIGLRHVLEEIREEGLDSLFSRGSLNAEVFRGAMKALGLKLFAPDSPSDSITAVYAPEGTSAPAIVGHLSARYGITIAGGQDHIREKVFRVSHMGYLDGLDMVTAVAAVEMTLSDLGCPVALGAGVKAAQEILTGSQG